MSTGEDSGQEDSDAFNDEIEVLFSERKKKSSEGLAESGSQSMSPFSRAEESEQHPKSLRTAQIPRPRRQMEEARMSRRVRESLPVSIAARQAEDREVKRYHPSQEPYEGGFVSVDESPYRLREIFQVKELWRESLLHPGRTYTNLMDFMKPLSLWQSLHAYLIGGKALQEIQSSRRLRLQYERGIVGIRNAVLGGEFMWRGKSGIYIQGEMRRGMEPRIYRSDVKEMDELIEKQRRRTRPVEVNEDQKAMLEAFFQDRLVVEVLRVVLEPVFETTFSDSSHGFRPGRTQHTALKQIRRDFNDATWIFRSDLRGVFELILENRRKFTSKLQSLIETRVKDKQFLELLFTGLNTNTILSNYEINPPEEGYSPLNTKSGIVPLLINIYFDPLDQWITRKGREINRGKYRRINPEIAALVLRGMENKVANTMLPLDPNDPVFRRVSYCRFADDFVFGLAGPRDLALDLQQEFWQFAAAQLQFPLPACKVNHVSFKTRFLGHILRKRVIMPRKALLEVKRTNRGRISQEVDAEEVEVGGSRYQVPDEKLDPELEASKSLNGNIAPITSQGFVDGPKEILSIDGETDKIIRLLARAGYCHKNGDPQPNFKHLHFSQSETNQIVRRMLLSICDFYRIARNRQRVVHYASYVLRHSVAKMYAAKFKLRSRAKVFKRGGSHLGARIQYGKGYIGKIDPDTGRGTEEYAELPYARLGEIPKPDLLPLPPDWQPEIMHILNEKLIGNIPRF